jgi:hypothetical protein
MTPKQGETGEIEANGCCASQFADHVDRYSANIEEEPDSSDIKPPE